MPPETTGKKDTKGKLPLYIVLFEQFPDAIKELVKCSKLGHDKYELDGDWTNFKRVPRHRDYLDATLRHLEASKGGLAKSDDGDIYHLAQAMWNITAFLQIELETQNSKRSISDDMDLYIQHNAKGH